MESLPKSNLIFDLTNEEYEVIKDKLMLNEEYSKILKMKIKKYSITKMSLELHLSERTINRRVRELKRMMKKVI